MHLHGKSKEVKRRLRELIPDATLDDFLSIEDKANAGHLRHLPASIRAWQALTTHIRHVHTDYDELIKEGYGKNAARHFVFDDINHKLQEWGCTKKLSSKEQ